MLEDSETVMAVTPMCGGVYLPAHCEERGHFLVPLVQRVNCCFLRVELGRSLSEGCPPIVIEDENN